MDATIDGVNPRRTIRGDPDVANDASVACVRQSHPPTFQKEMDQALVEAADLIVAERTRSGTSVKARLNVADARRAAWDAIFPPVYTNIRSTNLVIPVPAGLKRWARALRKDRRRLAVRALYAIYFNICVTGNLDDSIAGKLMATWVWGVGSVPPHWRKQLAAILPLIVHVSADQAEGKDRIEITFDPEKCAISYKASSSFLCELESMVSGDTIKFVRYYKTNTRPRDAQLHQLTRVLGYEDYVGQRGEPSAGTLVRRQIEQERENRAKAITLSTLGRAKRLSMMFVPSFLGDSKLCRERGLVARALAQNHTRSSTVTNAKIANYGGSAKVSCGRLRKGVTYDIFAGNGTWKTKGYFASVWLKHHGLKAGQEAKLFTLWAAATEPLKLIIVGIDKDNSQYDLDAMIGMIGTAPGKLWRLNIRIYSTEDWQTRWTEFFRMPLPGPTAMVGAKRGPTDPPGDLPEIAELVRHAGGGREMARLTGIDHSDLAKYLKTGRGLSAAKAAKLRRHLRQCSPKGGPEIAEEFAAILDEYPGNLGYALAYRRLLRWSVVPIVPRSRSGYWPYGKYQCILPSEEEIISWWTAHPDASIGLMLGALSGVFAFDVDNAAAERELLKLIGKNPQCPIQRSGGWAKDATYHKHYLYQYPVDVHAGGQWEPILKGLEFRGSHGLLIMAPSYHKTSTPDDQKIYNWSEPGHEIWSLAMPPLPQPALDLLIAHGKGESPAKVAHKVNNISKTSDVVVPTLRYKGIRFSMSTQQLINGEVLPGARNNRLFEAGKELRDRGLTEAEAATRLLPGAETSGLEAREVLSTIASVYSQPTRPRRAR